MSAHATAAGHVALIAVDQNRAAQLAPEIRAALGDLGWANCIHTHWRLTAAGRTALEHANRTALLARRLRSST